MPITKKNLCFLGEGGSALVSYLLSLGYCLILETDISEIIWLLSIILQLLVTLKAPFKENLLSLQRFLQQNSRAHWIYVNYQVEKRTWPRAELKTMDTVYCCSDRPRPLNNIYLLLLLLYFFLNFLFSNWEKETGKKNAIISKHQARAEESQRTAIKRSR